MLVANAGPLLGALLSPYDTEFTAPLSSYSLLKHPLPLEVAAECEGLLTKSFGPNPHRKGQVASAESYALLRHTGYGLKCDVVGFARLQPSAKDPRGATWGMISSVVVRPKGSGIGRELMKAMETEALVQGYTYSCVWMDDDSLVGFYHKCGYAESEPASTSSVVLSSNKLSLSALNKLFQARTPANGQKCMRKRLVVKKSSTLIPVTLKDEEKVARKELQVMLGENTEGWDVSLRVLPWERQIGPCCGLAAIRMVGRYFSPAWEDETDALMQTAIGKGYSKDGEIFDIDHLAALGTVVTGHTYTVRTFEEVSMIPGEVLFDAKSFASRKCLVILPYDKGSGSGYPELRGGMFSHYCVIVGVASNSQTNQVVYFAHHGASSRLIGALREDWIASNAQLLKRDTVRYKDDTDAINLARFCVVVTVGAT